MGINWRKLLQPNRAREEPEEPAGKVTSIEITDQQIYEAVKEASLRELAFCSCVEKISAALSMCEFRTFLNGREVFGDEYYLWNYSPNRNQNKVEFWNTVITKLYKDNEVLIVETADGQLLVADGFTVRPNTFYGDSYSEVSVGDYDFRRTFHSEDVIHLKLNNRNVNQVLRRMQDSYGELIDYARGAFLKSRGSRGILDISSLARTSKDFDETLKKMMNEYFKDFFKANNAVLPLFEGYKYTDLGSKTYSESTSRDIKNQYDDIFDFTARAFNIPPVLLTGGVQDTSQAVDDMLMFCIDPLCMLIQTEINRKRSGPDAVRRGTCLKVYTGSVKHVDVLDAAASMEKVVGSGLYSVNMVLRLLGEPPIDEEWADKHWITKNFEDIENGNAQEGGENG